MEFKNAIWTAISAVVCFFLLTATACKKTTAPTSDAVYQTSPAFSAEELKQQRLSWNLKTLVEPYEHAGFTSSKWDASAELALTEFARARAGILNENEPWAQIISTNAAAAVRSGCDDPMIAYLYTRLSLSQTNSRERFSEAFNSAARNMQETSYPNIRKFYACFRAGDQIEYTWGTNRPAEMNYFWDLAITNLGIALQDQSTPVAEVDDACNEAADKLLSNRQTRDVFYYQVEAPLFNHWTNADVSWLLRGQYCIDCAWAARGGGYGNTVTPEGWKLFSEHLKGAEDALTRAWAMNPRDARIPTKMLTVELGQGQGRQRMELWFNRAMAINTNDYDACSAKLYYLEPKWYGSTEAMLEFGRQCATNKAWGGHIPLILLDAHKSIQRQYVNDSQKTNYWKQPEVWTDLKTAFGRFFELNPDATGWYHDYAWYAYQAGQWDTLNKIIPKLGPINYSFFGGTNEFNKMVQLAKEHASNPR